MAATEEHRHARAPPPTPIATGKGLRSAAVNDSVLSDYLETLSIPSLALPPVSAAPARGLAPTEVDLSSLVSGKEESVQRMVELAAAEGAFWIRDGGRAVVPPEALRSAVEMGDAVFRIPEERKRELSGWFGRRREGVGEEFYWDWRRRSAAEIETVLQEVWPGDYRIFREKMDSIASKMEMVAQCVQKNLSKHVNNQGQNRRVKSILCLRKYENCHFDGNEAAHNHNSHALILHLYAHDDKFTMRSPEDSDNSSISPGSLLVTFGEKVQGWCRSGFKSGNEGVISEISDAPDPSGPMELGFSSKIQAPRDLMSVKTVTIMDQILIMIVLTLICVLWA